MREQLRIKKYFLIKKKMKLKNFLRTKLREKKEKKAVYSHINLKIQTTSEWSLKNHVYVIYMRIN